MICNAVLNTIDILSRTQNPAPSCRFAPVLEE